MNHWGTYFHLYSAVAIPYARGSQQSYSPKTLFAELKKLTGRARELLANRIAVGMNYFVLVDEPWVTELVIDPMLSFGATSDRLWEAFARYSPIPSPTLWSRLEMHLLKRLHSIDLTPDSKRRLSEMATIVWVWGCRGREYSLKDSNLRSALSLANEDVRAAAAWQFASVFNDQDAETNESPSVQERWRECGRRFFDQVWPLEPALQSPASANDFARIPVSVGPEHFGEVVSVITPFIVPFKVWALATEFHLELSDNSAKEIIHLHPDELLALLSLSISDEQGHGVYDLGPILDEIVSSHPRLENDYRIQQLRRMAAQIGS